MTCLAVEAGGSAVVVVQQVAEEADRMGEVGNVREAGIERDVREGRTVNSEEQRTQH